MHVICIYVCVCVCVCVRARVRQKVRFCIINPFLLKALNTAVSNKYIYPSWQLYIELNGPTGKANSSQLLIYIYIYIYIYMCVCVCIIKLLNTKYLYFGELCLVWWFQLSNLKFKIRAYCWIWTLICDIDTRTHVTIW